MFTQRNKTRADRPVLWVCFKTEKKGIRQKKREESRLNNWKTFETKPNAIKNTDSQVQIQQS